MKKTKPSAHLKVRLYHDETKDVKIISGKRHAHGILVVPEELLIEDPSIPPLFSVEPHAVCPRCEFLKDIYRVRKLIDFDRELHASGMSGKEWGKREACGAKVLALACDYLRHKGAYGKLASPFFRFGALFFPKGTPQLREYYSGKNSERKLKYFETLMRMAIKGTLHYGYNGLDHAFSSISVEVLGLVLDGNEHLPRPIDQGRVINRLRSELRPGLSIADDFDVRAVDSDPKKYHLNTRERDDSEILQVTDLLLGAVRFLAEDGNRTMCKHGGRLPKMYEKFDSRTEKMARVYQPFCNLQRKSAERIKKNRLAWENSGHYRSFTVSKAGVRDGDWYFERLDWILDEETQLLVPLFPNNE